MNYCANNAGKLKSLFPDKRYQRHVGKLIEAILTPNGRTDIESPAPLLPFYEYDSETGLGLLVFEPASAANTPVGRAGCICVVGLDTRQDVEELELSQALHQLILRTQNRCDNARYSDMLVRCADGLLGNQAFRDALPSGWSLPDRVRSYKRHNLHGLDNELRWLQHECQKSLPSDIKIVTVDKLDRPFCDYDMFARAMGAHPELCPRVADLEARYSFFAVTKGELLGWSVVSRRRDSLLYNRWFIDPTQRRFWSLGVRLVGAGLLEHRACEPNTAVRFRVRLDDQKIAKLYEQYLAPLCDRRHDDVESFRYA